jgi:crotonobetainyl-CoA:carnitine CoA-transferase CaiB-like acyl-CoA transferase
MSSGPLAGVRVVELAGIGFVMVILLAGPEDLAAVNPGLVYGRMTGWGWVGSL